MSSIMQQSVRSFVTLLLSRDNMRDSLTLSFADAALDNGVGIVMDVEKFAKQFSKQVLAALRAKGALRLLRSATSRISEAKRIYVAAKKGDKGALKVLRGKLAVSAYLESVAKKGKGKGAAKLTAKSFAKRVASMLADLRGKQRREALSALAKLLRSKRAAR